MTDLMRQMTEQRTRRIERIAAMEAEGGLDQASAMKRDAMTETGSHQAYGTGP